jgi:CRP-like cAMP-binding protein
MRPALNPKHNQLLAALPAAELERLAPRLEAATLPLGQMLYEPGEQLEHAYFPLSAIVSLHYVTASGALKQEFDRHGPLQRLLLRYTQALMAQMTQTAVCNRHHSVEQQLCRWLLTTLDRVPSGQIVMTQELVAGMLGVRREGITAAAGRLQDAGFIRSRRGHIAVLERAGLETLVCECYAVVKNEFRRLLSEVRQPQGAAAA